MTTSDPLGLILLDVEQATQVERHDLTCRYMGLMSVGRYRDALRLAHCNHRVFEWSKEGLPADWTQDQINAWLDEKEPKKTRK